jgi:hypothetical protein
MMEWVSGRLSGWLNRCNGRLDSGLVTWIFTCVHLSTVMHYTCIIKYINVLYSIRGPSTPGADDA